MLIAWENEALLLVNDVAKDRVEVVVPSVSILAEPPVAVVDANVDKHGTRTVAEAYLQFLYSDIGQQIAARHYFRPRTAVAGTTFANVATFTVDDTFGGWTAAQKTHFDDGAVFDQLYKPSGNRGL